MANEEEYRYFYVPCQERNYRLNEGLFIGKVTIACSCGKIECPDNNGRYVKWEDGTRNPKLPRAKLNRGQ